MPWVYHELQDASLCGIHALNNLLQGPYFGVESLSEIAAELDRREKDLMAEMGTDTEEYKKFAKEESINVGMGGDFSANVLQEALEKVWNLQCEDTRKSEVKREIEAAPSAEKGYLCHLEDHWIALRKLEEDGSWWNLNSLEDDPTRLSELYLGAFLKQLQLEGWTIYVVRGEYPPDAKEKVGQFWRFVDANHSLPPHSNRANHDEDDEEAQFQREMQAAIAASMSGQNNDQLPPSLSIHSPSSAAHPIDTHSIDDEVDEDLLKAIEMSKQTE